MQTVHLTYAIKAAGENPGSLNLQERFEIARALTESLTDSRFSAQKNEVPDRDINTALVTVLRTMDFSDRYKASVTSIHRQLSQTLAEGATRPKSPGYLMFHWHNLTTPERLKSAKKLIKIASQAFSEHMPYYRFQGKVQSHNLSYCSFPDWITGKPNLFFEPVILPIEAPQNISLNTSPSSLSCPLTVLGSVFTALHTDSLRAAMRVRYGTLPKAITREDMDLMIYSLGQNFNVPKPLGEAGAAYIINRFATEQSGALQQEVFEAIDQVKDQIPPLPAPSFFGSRV